MLTVQVLLRRLNEAAAPDYLAVLVSMELSLHNLEVVSRLISSMDIPQDFINNYIAGCIAACDRAEVCEPSWPVSVKFYMSLHHTLHVHDGPGCSRSSWAARVLCAAQPSADKQPHGVERVR